MNTSSFGQTAKSLSRSPLGIIALFIVLIYGIAALVFGISTNQLESTQKWPLIWFLVLFPPVVLLAFVWLVANHSLKLYAPSDFRDDESFVRLNNKVSVLELRQYAAQVDPRGDPNTAYEVLEKLLQENEVEAARNLSKAFLKIKRFEVSLQMFDMIINHDGVPQTLVNRTLAYRAYSLIGLGRYREAVEDLVKVQSSECDEFFDFWPRLGLAYCHMKLGNYPEFEAMFNVALSDKKAADYLNLASKIYPEFAEKLVLQVSPSATAPNESS